MIAQQSMTRTDFNQEYLVAAIFIESVALRHLRVACEVSIGTEVMR